MWVLTVLILPSFVHAERKVVARLTRRTTATTALMAARVLAFSVLAGVLGGFVLAWLHTTAPWWLVLPVLLLVVGWVGAGAVAVFTVLVSRLARTRRVEVAARSAHSAAQRRADQTAHRRADWALDSAGSRLPNGGLTLIYEHERRIVPPGQSIAADAATVDHVRVYRRYGFAPLATAPFKLLATV